MKKLLGLVLLFGAIALFAGCASSKDQKWVRESKGCECAQMMGAGKCKCQHCSGEPGSKCYCGTGGCKCGLTMGGCGCGHCTGKTGEPECDCAKHSK